MLVSILSWIYIGMYCLAAGILVRGLLGRFFAMEKDPERMSVTGTIVYGFIGITVYAEIYSLFGGVGMACHLLLLAAVVIYHIAFRQARSILYAFLSRLRRLCCSWEGFFLLFAVLAAAYFTSRGTFHTDTGIYHAQAIRIIEDYGIVKGIANLQLHYGYNSSYLVFCAFFTMRWLTGTALHTTTGFLFALLGCWAFHGLWRIRSHTHYGADALRAAILIYVLTNLTDAMSPATDCSTIILVIYLVTVFVETAENRPGRKGSGKARTCLKVPVNADAAVSVSGTAPDPSVTTGSGRICPEIRKENVSSAGISPAETVAPKTPAAVQEDASEKYLTLLGTIAIGGLFTVSMKLSAAAVFLLAIYPLVMFLRRRNWKAVLRFTGLGIVVFVPYLVRNVILTGWLFYPVGAIDLFDVEWKVPLAYLEKDAAQIEVWGRSLYDVDLVDLSVFEWFPTWWEEQQHYAQMLVYANVLSVPLYLCDLMLARHRGKAGCEGIRWEMVTVAGMMYAGLAMWFFTAPFFRYGLAFILEIPLLAVGLLAENLRGRLHPSAWFWRVGGLWLSILTAMCFCSWIDNYVMDDLVFIKQNLTEPYYIFQKPFDDNEMYSMEMENGVTVYYAAEEDKGSYYAFPSTTYKSMLDRTEMIGDTVEEGFRAR